MGYQVGRMAWVDNKAWTTMQFQESGNKHKKHDETVPRPEKTKNVFRDIFVCSKKKEYNTRILTDYFISLVFLSQMRKENVKDCIKWIYVAFYPCLYWGQSIFMTVSTFSMLNQLVAGSIMVRHMKLILVFSLPLRVYCLMRSTHNAC